MSQSSVLRTVRISWPVFSAVVALMAASIVGSTAGWAQNPAQKMWQQLQQQSELSETQRSELEKILSPVADTADTAAISDALTAALMVRYPDYAAAVAAADEDQLDEAQAKLSQLVDSPDSFLAADATFYLARVLVNHDRFEAAVPLLEKVTGPLAQFTTHGAASQYFIGTAYAGLLQNDQAIAALMDFLQNHLDAPERLRVSAWRQVQELQAIQKDQIAEVHQRMDFSRRRLEIEEPGDRTQEEQDKIVKKLSEMIKEEEKKECSSGSCKNPSQSQQQQQQQQSQNKPQDKSESQTGGMSSVANGKAVNKEFEGADSAWSRLRDRSRDAANTATKEKLPARYRDIVERYMDAVNGNAGKDK